MTPKQIFESKLINLNKEILALHPNDHKRRKYVRTLITDELLKYLYYIEKMSANSICKYFTEQGIRNGGASVIIHRLKTLNKETRGIKETCYLETVRGKKTITLKNKYNVTNISQIPDVKKKKAQQCVEKYGVNNNFKSKEIKQKIKLYWRNNYGVDHPSEIRVPSHRYFYISKPHKDALVILNELNIVYEYEINTYFKAFNPVMERRFCPRVDIYIPSKKLVIEVFGSYWHANPIKYKSTDLFHTVYGPLTARQIWDRDKIKIDHIKSLGFKLEIVWDTDININYIKNIISKYEDFKN